MAPTVAITGASGFLGQALAAELLENTSFDLLLTDISEPSKPAQAQDRVQTFAADLTDLATIANIFSASLELHGVFTLHGIMSGGAEANLDAGLSVNLDSHRQLLASLAKSHQGAKIVFPSSLAVFGPMPSTAPPTTESTIPLPRSSYGAQKHMIETLLSDFSRRGLLDGRIRRLPTVIVRPGAPSAAASSFASGMVRESLKGEKNILPVRKDLEMWITSPKIVVKNLVHAISIDASRFDQFAAYGSHTFSDDTVRAIKARIINLPGKTVTVNDILNALEEVGGRDARNLIEEKHDPSVEAIVGSWPSRFHTDAAKMLGFYEDIDLQANIRDFKASLG